MTTSLELANHVLDAQFSFSIKLIVLIILTLFALYGIMYVGKKKDENSSTEKHVLEDELKLDNYATWVLFKIFIKIFSYTWIIFLPIWVLVLLRSAVDTLYIPLLGFYGIAFAMTTVLVKVISFEFLAKLLGIDITPSRYKSKEKNRWLSND